MGELEESVSLRIVWILTGRRVIGNQLTRGYRDINRAAGGNAGTEGPMEAQLYLE